MRTKKQDEVSLFEYATKDLLKAFCKKQDLIPDYSVGGDRIDVFYISDFFFNISDIYFDLKSNQPVRKIVEWYYYISEHDVNINYYSYCMGLRKEQLNKKQND